MILVSKIVTFFLSILLKQSYIIHIFEENTLKEKTNK